MGNESNKKTYANGIQSNKKNHAMVFRATNKLMLWYLEQQVNQCYRQFEQQGNPCPSFRDNFFCKFGFEQNFLTKTEKHKFYLNNRIDWEHVLE